MFGLTLLKAIGSKVALFLGIVLVVFLSVNYIQRQAENNTLKEQKIEQIEKEINIRNRVDEILQKNYDDNPNRDGNVALDRLRERYKGSAD